MRKQSIANAGKTHFRHIGRNLIIQSRESMTNGAYSPRDERRKVRKRMELIKNHPKRVVVLAEKKVIQTDNITLIKNFKLIFKVSKAPIIISFYYALSSEFRVFYDRKF